MSEKEEFFMEIVQDVRNILEKKEFDFKTFFGFGKLSTRTGMKKEEFIVEREDLSILITIREVEKSSPR